MAVEKLGRPKTTIEVVVGRKGVTVTTPHGSSSHSDRVKITVELVRQDQLAVTVVDLGGTPVREVLSTPPESALQTQ